jgi:hypothetical protein
MYLNYFSFFLLFCCPNWGTNEFFSYHSSTGSPFPFLFAGSWDRFYGSSDGYRKSGSWDRLKMSSAGYEDGTSSSAMGNRQLSVSSDTKLLEDEIHQVKELFISTEKLRRWYGFEPSIFSSKRGDDYNHCITTPPGQS